ncbi:MAG: hypothetical protein ACFB9N_10075 [Geitlerinemataceae cyanobacterium]
MNSRDRFSVALTEKRQLSKIGGELRCLLARDRNVCAHLNGRLEHLRRADLTEPTPP